jgi:choline dehydrogenase-like flavoprotein
MISDANSIDTGTSLDCDICIVGAGAAGIAISLQFLRSNLRVILLESGTTVPDAATQQLYAAEIVDHRMHSPGERYRARRFGGSTTIWGGRCVPFDQFDFTQRPWVTEQSWPIEYSEVSRYYRDANELCEAGELVYDAAGALPGGMRPMIRGFEPAHFSADGIERFSCPTDFGVRYRQRLMASQNVQVLLNANCTELLTDPDGTHVERLSVRTLAGVSLVVRATQVILAMGGLEIPRLLLASRRTCSGGLGNDYDQVGRNYMCHIAGTVGALSLDVPREDVWHGYEVADDGTYCRRRLALTWPAQRDFGLASSIVRLHFPSIPDPAHRTGALSALYLAKPLIPYEYAKRLTGEGAVSVGTWLRHVANVAADAPYTASFLLHWLRKRTLVTRKFPSVVVRPRANRFSLDYHAEQQPNSASRVTLGRENDQLGLPKLLIDWRYSALDVRTAIETLRLLREDLATWGHGRLDYDPDRVEQQITRDGAYGGHHIGTARMGHCPATSVVDRNCRVHGLRNLYVAGSAVFATSSQANPTLTIVALALRLADHIRQIMDDGVALRADPFRTRELEAPL